MPEDLGGVLAQERRTASRRQTFIGVENEGVTRVFDRTGRRVFDLREEPSGGRPAAAHRLFDDIRRRRRGGADWQ